MVRVIDEVIVDLLGKACGVDYAQAVADREIVDVAGIEVPTASPRTLILTKRTYRPQDAADRAFLESLLADRPEP